MSSEFRESPYPTGHERQVPMDLYLADRRDMRIWMERMEAKLDNRLDRMQAAIDELQETRAAGLGGTRERRRLAAVSYSVAMLALAFAGFLLTSAGVFG